MCKQQEITRSTHLMRLEETDGQRPDKQPTYFLSLVELVQTQDG
jgi:hypothetical protein